MEQKRSIAADLIRCLAFFLVVSVHFFLHNGFYSYPVVGKRMLIMNIMRALFIICVPLFLTLSGYLLRKKELSIKYFTRITDIALTYVLSSIACIIFSVVCLHSELSITSGIAKLFNFTGAPYAWYIEMYFGLFLMIPFLNILYNNIPSQRWKIGLIVAFVVLTSLPAVTNVYNFSSLSWWSLPSSSYETNQLIPDWWVGFYPVTYYFIGCYLAEYGLKINKALNLLLIALCTVASGVYTYWRSYEAFFISGSWCDYQSLFNIILTVLVFAFFINLNYDGFPKFLSRFIQKVSGLCLGAYLVSWIFDSIFYPMLLKKVPHMIYRLEHYFIIVPVVFVLSLMLSYFLSKIQLLIKFISRKIRLCFHRNQQHETTHQGSWR